MAKEIADEYTSSLADLTLNSKPLINMLTMLADDNIEHAEAIVQAVENHLEKVRSEFKLPVLYLIDSIVKNVGRSYTQLFTQNIVNTFCSVFEKVEEKVRAQMFKLRQTWSDVFPIKKLYALDIRVQCIDPAWPIIALPPKPSIHVNPKFFNKPPPVAPTTVAGEPVTTAENNVDHSTFDMHAQLITKQKELLELKQKRLELELLQAKAKLEEQQKQFQIPVNANNVLDTSNCKPLQGTKIQKNKIQSGRQSPGKHISPNNVITGTRIAPVNSVMIAASTRPAVRDPRLLKQQAALKEDAFNGVVTISSSLDSTQLNSNNFENVNLDDTKVKSKSNSTVTIDCATDKTSLNKSDNTLNRKDPRLLSNKAPGSSTINKSKSNNGRPISSERSPTKTKTSPNLSRKSSTKSSSRSSFKSSNSNPVNKLDVASSVISEGGNSSSISNKSVKESGNKGSSDSNKSTPSSSLNKYKKRTEHNSQKNNKSVEQKRTKSSSSTKSPDSKSRSRDRGSDKYDDDSLQSSALSQDQRAFKGLKCSTKNRNYMRRNRTVSISPEPSHDVDLRVYAPPEKLPRLHPVGDKEEQTKILITDTSIVDNQGIKDVDLRTLIPLVTKKRPSSEKLDGIINIKKNKSEMFHVLFGNEDVDLRQLPPLSIPQTLDLSAFRPQTPPPPIISLGQAITKHCGNNPGDKTEWNAIRAKLAIATKVPPNNNVLDKIISEDTDMRKKPLIFGSSTGEKIIISKDDEQCIKEGNLSQALVEKVLTLFETQKLQEAQRREFENIKKSDTNVSLQPISDDELSVDFSHSDSDEDSRRNRKAKLIKLKNNRLMPSAPAISNTIEKEKAAHINHFVDHQKDMKKKHFRANFDQRHLNPRIPQNMEHNNWHPRRRKMQKSHWELGPPPHHLGLEPWMRTHPPPTMNSQSMNHPPMNHPSMNHPPMNHPPMNHPPINHAQMNHPSMNHPPPMMNLYGQPPPVIRRPFPPPTFMRPPIDNFIPRMEMPMTIIPPHVIENNRTTSPPNIGSQNTKELPPADPLVLEYIEKDTMRAINIDGRLREIRYYDDLAIAIMSWDDPREICFQSGSRLVSFDDKEFYILTFNEPYKEVLIHGKTHRVRLGAPTRELYIDDKWYECFFGGPGVGIELDGKICVVKLEGPPPHVKIGNTKRTDLVAGKISLIIDARTMIPIFLDAKPQKFDIEGKLHTLRFVDSLMTVLINEVPFKVEFGGLPKPITVHDKKHFIRFSILPKGVVPGNLKITNMEGNRYNTPPPKNDENSNDTTMFNNIANSISTNEPALPMLGKRKMRPVDREVSPDRNSPNLQNSYLHSFGTLDVLSSMMTSPMSNSKNINGYKIESTHDSQDDVTKLNKTNEISGPPVKDISAPPSSVPFLGANLNINELFQKLVETGIVTADTSQKAKEDDSIIKPVLFSQPETLKVRQLSIITTLYSGMQCSSCGVRFPLESSVVYSQHLDWHFRQNRKGKNSARKALCRKWFYEVSDWKNYEEIEDVEEREKNWFESQQQQGEGVGEDGDPVIEVPSVPADSNAQETFCDVCHDKFDQFYNEEKEEWHLKMAVRVDEKTYHPVCYEDYKQSLLHSTLQDTLNGLSLSQFNDSVETDDSQVSELKEDNSSDSETDQNTDNKSEKEVKQDDDEVIIQEPKIEEIIIDEDDLEETMEYGELKTEKNFPIIQIKQEPIDDIEICVDGIKTEAIDPEMEDAGSFMNNIIPADTTHTEIITSIDGNVQLNSGTPISIANSIPGKIKINITKPIIAHKETSIIPVISHMEFPIPRISPVDITQPLPPGEEPVQLNVKPALKGIQLKRHAPILRGTELSGLCSIM